MPGPGFKDFPENINKEGRPPKGQALTDILSGKVDKDEIADMLIAKVREGDLAAIKYVYDRIDGKPKESLELEQREVQPLVTRVDSD